MLTNMDDETQVLETEPQEEEVVEVEEEEETVESIKAQLEKEKAEKAELEKKNKQLYERAKKAETTPKGDLEQKDILYLAKADIHEDDIDEVLETAKLKKISVQEAHKYLTPILKERNEERRTQQATETKSPRGIAKVTGEDVLRKAEQSGEVPDSIDQMKAMLQARLDRKRK